MRLRSSKLCSSHPSSPSREHPGRPVHLTEMPSLVGTRLRVPFWVPPPAHPSPTPETAPLTACCPGPPNSMLLNLKLRFPDVFPLSPNRLWILWGKSLDTFALVVSVGLTQSKIPRNVYWFKASKAILAGLKLWQTPVGGHLGELCVWRGAHSKGWACILTGAVSEDQPGGEEEEVEVRTPVTQPGELGRCTQERAGSDKEDRAGRSRAESAPHKPSLTMVINEWTPFYYFLLKFLSWGHEIWLELLTLSHRKVHTHLLTFAWHFRTFTDSLKWL